MTLEDIVEMLKISEGHLQLKISNFDLTEVVHQVVVDLRPFLERRNQQVKRVMWSHMEGVSGRNLKGEVVAVYLR